MPEPRKTDAELAKEMQTRYRNVFGTAEGRIVLGDILTLGHFGEPILPTDSAAVSENNAAILIARMAGAFDLLYDQLGMTKEN
jgi:hypothetical protein